MSPISNQPSASEINVELGRASNAAFSMNGAAERALAQVPTGPISMNDFIGKSAQTPFETYLQFIDDLTAGNAVLTGSNAPQNMVGGANHKVTNIVETGTMYGSLFAPNGTISQDSVLNRVCQHAVESYAEFVAIQNNSWPIAMSTPGIAIAPLFQAFNRNSYSSVAYGASFGATTSVTTYWWDGQFAWKRVNALARELAYPQ